MDALELLKADHKTVTELLDELEDTTERAVKTREKLFAKVYGELILHEKLEEELLYPLLKQEDSTKEITLESYQEHHVIDILLKELNKMNVTDEAWSAKIKVLKENLEHHIQAEENKMFPKTKKIMDKSTLIQLGEKMQQIKQAKSQL